MIQQILFGTRDLRLRPPRLTRGETRVDSVVNDLPIQRVQEESGYGTTVLRTPSNIRVLGLDRVRSDMDSKNRLLSSSRPSEDLPLNLRNRQLDPGAAIVADLAGSTSAPHDRFLLFAVKENIDRAGGDAGSAVHAEVLVHNLLDEVAEDLELNRPRFPAFTLNSRLQRHSLGSRCRRHKFRSCLSRHYLFLVPGHLRRAP